MNIVRKNPQVLNIVGKHMIGYRMVVANMGQYGDIHAMYGRYRETKMRGRNVNGTYAVGFYLML